MHKPRRTFLRDLVDFSSLAVTALHADNFTRCFEPISPLEMDNSGIFYIFSVLTRYFILFPSRLLILACSTCVFVPLFSLCLFFKWRTESVFRAYSQSFLWSFGAKIHHHGTKRRETVPHVYIANHTSFVDYIILSSHRFCHACVSENHGGLFGFLFRNILASNGSICFKRSEKKDREIVSKKLRDHIQNTNNTPMLVFPEGTCVNNKYTVLFQKGVFEVQDVLFLPVAVKFRRNLMDPYWNRRKHTFTEHLLYLMTRWRLEADVWWMDGVTRGEYPNEHPSEFANRIKEMISEKGGLKSVLWNGYFKSSPVLKDREILREAYREVYVKRELFCKAQNDECEGEHRFKRKGKKSSNNVNDINSNGNNGERNNFNDKNGSDPIVSENNNNTNGYINSNTNYDYDSVEIKHRNNNTNNISSNNLCNNNANIISSSYNNNTSNTNNTNNTSNTSNTSNTNISNISNNTNYISNTSIYSNIGSKNKRCVNKFYRNRNYNKKNNKIKEIKNEKNKEKIYFERFTYDEYVDSVLKEYLELKKSDKLEITSEGFWWGYRNSNMKCKCDSKIKKGLYCHEGACRSEFFDMHRHKN
ncbi:hypothetical protein COBT_001168 [Conglomerata obtusa]